MVMCDVPDTNGSPALALSAMLGRGPTQKGSGSATVATAVNMQQQAKQEGTCNIFPQLVFASHSCMSLALRVAQMLSPANLHRRCRLPTGTRVCVCCEVPRPQFPFVGKALVL